MRDAARKLADRLHLLALHELRFQRLQPRRVVQDRQPPGAPAIDVAAQGDLQEAFLVAPHPQHLRATRMPPRRHIGQPFRYRTP